MSDQIKHECGIAFLRLLKPLEFYRQKYGTPLYGLNKMYLLMEKQHNRGQDGAGIANIKFDPEPGHRFISRSRSIAQTPIKDLFERISSRVNEARRADKDILYNIPKLKREVPFAGELYLGHLRYGTYGRNSIESCHPFLRQNNRMTQNLIVAGNFNLTNVDELFDELIELGQHPKEKADTVTVMEKIGHFLDKENEKLYREYRDAGIDRKEAVEKIAENLDIETILKKATERFDGGYVMSGLMGHGDGFVLRDPNGIRPAYYYHDDEIAVVCSERAVIQTVFNVAYEGIHELPPGHAFIVKKSGKISISDILNPAERKACSFERIYFSRGSDAEIYSERKELGNLVVPQILNKIEHDLDNTVFSFIPNTAETAFYGMLKGVENYLNTLKADKIKALGNTFTAEQITEILAERPRVEKLAIKDVKLRTFITDDEHRDDMVTHVYDITYGTVKPGTDNVVVIDDSIVRGTTLKKSIIRMLDRLNPKHIVIVSSAPQIRYPDCYGIDMAKIQDFIAFKAATALLEERGLWHVITDAYTEAKELEKQGLLHTKNCAKQIYAPFTDEEISDKIAELVSPPDIKSKVSVVYQSVDNLHKACPLNLGDWYFTGDYPTPGGMRVSNRALINFVEGKNARAY
ncbi:MAG: amidophosphoribosyltransferase [Flavobacteriales bacterium]|nr:amidophosphoribosyltransferase [Flavobacteriales bacterium]